MKFPKVYRDEIKRQDERVRAAAAAEKAFCKITLKTKMHYCHLKCKHALSCHRSFESWLFLLPSSLPS